MEPERKIEKLLRAFAKKRRTEAGDAFKLHPVTRRRLQDAAARQVSPPSDTGWLLKFLGGLRPGLVMVAGFGVLMFMGAALLLPALSKAKSRAQAASAMGNLKQIGLAARGFAEENQQQLPESLNDIARVIGTNQLNDPASGQPFVYVAGGRAVDSLRADSVLAYSPADSPNRAVLFADGRVETVNRKRFSEITNLGLIQLAAADTSARRLAAEIPPAAAPVLAGNEYGSAKAKEPAALALNSAPSEARSADKLETAGADRKEPVMNSAGGIATGTSVPEREVKLDGLVTTHNLDFSIRNNSTNLLPGQAGGAPPLARNFSNNTLQNLFRNAVASTKAIPVLANFQIYENGGTIAVVDEDGSIYNGQLVAAPSAVLNASSAARAAAERDAGLKKNSPAPEQGYFFRVTGTNRTLNQSVVFTGNVFALTNAAQSGAQSTSGFARGGSGGGNFIQQSSAQQTPADVFFDSRIEGTAVINQTNAVEIKALPVAP